MTVLRLFFILALLLCPEAASAWDVVTTPSGHAVTWRSSFVRVVVNAEESGVSEDLLFEAFTQSRSRIATEVASQVSGADPPFFGFEDYSDAHSIAGLKMEERKSGSRVLLLFSASREEWLGEEDIPYRVSRSFGRDRFFDFAVVEVNAFRYRFGEGNVAGILDLESVLTRAFLEVCGLNPDSGAEASLLARPLLEGRADRELGEDEKEALRALYPLSAACENVGRRASPGLFLLPLLLLRRKRS